MVDKLFRSNFRKVYLILALGIIFFGCSGRHGLTGVYISEILPNKNIVEIKNNGRFKYFIFHDVLGKQTFQGSWSMFKDTIDLDFDINENYSEVNLEIRYFEKKQKDSCFIRFIDEKNNPLVGRFVFLDSVEKFILNEEGKVYFKPKQIGFVSVKAFGRDEIVTLNISKYVDVDSEVKLNSGDNNVLYDMLPEKLIFRRNRLFYFKDEISDIRYPFVRYR